MKRKLRRFIKHLLPKLHTGWQSVKTTIARFFRETGIVMGRLSRPIRLALMGGFACLVVALVLICVAGGKRSRAASNENNGGNNSGGDTPVAGMSSSGNSSGNSAGNSEGTGESVAGGEQVIGIDYAAAPTNEAPAAPTAEPHPLNGKTYSKGDEGEMVAHLQVRLMELGYMDGDEPTEYFGSYTMESLMSFQRHCGVEIDGVLGESTYDLLFSEDAKVYVMQKGDSGDDVEDAQSRLYQLGYLERNCVTGEFGDKTEAAIMAFQAANRLTSDGKVGSKTLAKLYDEDVVGNYYEKGDKNDTIKKYQKRLINLGYLPDDTEQDGELDSAMVSAIKKFQDTNGLVKDGCLGPATMDALDSSDALTYALRLGMSGSDVKTMQKRLYKLGYISSSQVTGYYGETTQSAVITFQKRNSLSADGAAGSKTLAKLNSDNARAAASSSSGSSGSDDDDSKPTSGAKATPKPSSKTGVEKFIEIAKSKLGCTYVRGAKGPNTFDCSGFVYWCLNQAGVKQSYMTSIGWRSCSKYKRINSMSDMKRGDVIIFTGDGDGKGHVGIYLGNNQMIDASSSKGKVVIRTSVSTNYWKTHFYCAYRIWD